MRKLLHRFLLAACLLLVVPVVMAQTRVLQADFTGGLPTTWGQSPANAPVNWTTAATGVAGLSAYSGTDYAMLVASQPQSAVMLITERVNISALSSPVLNYWYALPQNGTDGCDILKVYYRTSPTSSWTLLVTESAAQSYWKQRVITLSDLNVTQIQFAFEYNYNSGMGIALDYVYVDNVSDCTVPENLSAMRITDTSAMLLWSASEVAEQFELKVSTVALSNMSQTADVFEGTVYVSPHIINGLLPSTDYFFYVRSYCGTEWSDWSDGATFKTLCSAANLPYSEGFNDGSFPACWSRSMSMFGDWGTSTPAAQYTPAVVASPSFEGAGALRLQSLYNNSSDYSSPRVTRAMAVTQEINATDMSALQVTFQAYSNLSGSRFYVGLMTEPTDFTTFEEVASLSVGSLSTWEEMTVWFDAATSNGKFIAFLVDGNDKASSTIYIDDLTVMVTPPCPKPSNVRARKITGNSVLLGWSSSNTTNWNVKVSTTPMTDMTAQADAFDGVVSTNPYLVTGLDQTTSYYVYIKSDCATDGVSSWSNQIDFTTFCADITTFPYVQGFDENLTNNFPDCWFRPVINGDYPKANSYKAITGSNALWIKSQEGVPTYIISQALGSNLNSLQVDFYLSTGLVPQSGVLEVGVMSNPLDTTTFELVKRIDPTKSFSKRFQIPFLNVTTQGVSNHLVFRHITNSTASGNYWMDDIRIDSLPSCVAPQAISLDGVGSKTATIKWESALGETQWNVKVSRGELDNPSTDIADVYTGTLNVDSLVLSGLQEGREYMFYIQSDCGDEVSSWNYIAFKTECSGSINELPYVETFTGYDLEAGLSSPSCWHFPRGAATIVASKNNTTAANSGSLYMVTSGGTPEIYAVLPMLFMNNVTIADVMLSFSYTGVARGYGMIVGVMDHPTDIASFFPIDTFLCNNANQTFENVVELTFEKYSGTGKYIAFFAKNGFSSEYSNIMYLDDVRLELIPDCRAVIDAAPTQVEDVSIALDWTARGTANTWELTIGTTSYNPDEVQSVTTTQPSYTFTGLSPNTDYIIYVRANCGGTDGNSLWTDPIFVSTTKHISSLPLIMDFEDEVDNARWTFVSGTQQNYFVIGDGVNNGGDKALYITNSTDGTNAHQYSNNRTSAVYAYRTVKFTPGVYRISYDWMGRGENRYDLGRFALNSPLVSLQAGDASGMADSFNDWPENWGIELSEGTMVSQATWKNVKKVISIKEETIFNLVLFWKNDNSAGTQPPLAIDNLIVEPLTCAPVTDLEANAIDTSAQIEWSNLLNLTKWDLKVSTVALDVDDMDNAFGDIFNDTVNVNSVTINGLKPTTPYYVYVRSNCPNGTVEDWTSMVFTTGCSTVKTLPYVETFDTYGTTYQGFPTCWTKAEDYMDYPYLGTSANHSYEGKSSLRFYTSSTTGLSYNVVASPMIEAVPLNQVIVSFHLYGVASHHMEVGAMTDPTDPSTFVAVDTVRLVVENMWEKKTVSFANYNGNGQYVAFRVGGQASYVSINMDDVTIIDNRTCTQPETLSVTRLGVNEARLNWYSDNETCAYNVIISETEVDPNEVSASDVVYLQGISDRYYMMNGLQEATTYYFYVQADCGDPVNSYWSDGYKFTTLCQPTTVPYAEDFSDYTMGELGLPNCWTANRTTIGNVTVNTNPRFENITSCGSQQPSLRFSSYYSSQYANSVNFVDATETGIVLPKFDRPLNQLYVALSTYSEVANEVLQVGVVTDASDISTFELIDTILLKGCQDILVSFASYQGTDGYMALILGGKTNNLFITELNVDTIANCQAATSVIDLNVTENSAELYWKAMAATDTLWQLRVTTEEVVDLANLDLITSFVLDTILNATNILLDQLDEQTVYYCYLRPVCGTDAYGPYYDQEISFKTLCPVKSLPYLETFSGMQLDGLTPNCWERYRGNINTVKSTGEFTETSSSWIPRISENPVDSHMVVYVYGANIMEWLVSPDIILPAAASLSFDLRLTEPNSDNAPDVFIPRNDDRLVVVVSEDGGRTWDYDNRMEWSGSAYYAIPTAWRNYKVDLSAYGGKKIKVAFYAESLVHDNYAYNDLHLDNVQLLELPRRIVQDQVCQNSAYSGNGFNIAAQENAEVGSYEYNRMTTTGGVDSVIVLQLDVMPTEYTKLSAVICPGSVYNENGFSESMSGIYRRNLNTQAGCDSVVELFLMVMSDTLYTDSKTICEGETPYLWNGQSITASGVYNATVNSSLGCDSLVELTLTILPEYHDADQVTISQLDLPYTYNGMVFDENTTVGVHTQIFRETTEAGCDSTLTLTLNVQPASGVVELAEGAIQLYPNPVKRDGEVMLNATFTEEELTGMNVEVFNAMGQLVKTIRPSQLPVRITGFTTSGIYVVKITTGTERVVYGKIVVR